MPTGIMTGVSLSMRFRTYLRSLPRVRAAWYRITDARQAFAGSTAPEAEDAVDFQCNICGTRNSVARARLGRETASCRICDSTVRTRSIIHLLSMAVYGRSIPLPDFPVNRAIEGAGLSDWAGYARQLRRKFRYRNTYFHRRPRLDITAPPEALRGRLDFLISTEVFEHVLPPVSRAFDGAFALLKPGGHLILTVPYETGHGTVEHYPELQDFTVCRIDGRFCVVVKNRDGSLALDPTPKFHGGPGQTLEVRLFGECDLVRALQAAGFVDIQVFSETVPAFGLYFPEPWSLPILARKPAA